MLGRWVAAPLLLLGPALAQQPLCGGSASTDACSAQGVEQRGYADNADCSRTFSANAGSAVSLSFTTFSVEAHFDWLEVFDGPSVAAPQLGRYSGTALPPGIVSSGNALTLRLSSDSSATGAGFAATIECLVPVGCDALPQVTHGSAEACVKLAHGEECQLVCDSGFTSLGVPLVCASGMTTSVLPSCARDCRQLGGDINQACTVATDGELAVGSVDATGPVFFAFQASAGVAYEIDVDIHELPGGLSDSVLVLYDGAANQLATNDDGLASDEATTGGCGGHNEEGCASFLRWRCPADGVYFAAVRGYGSGTGTFVVSVAAAGRMDTPPPPLLQPNDPSGLRLSTDCFLGSVSGDSPACHSRVHEEEAGANVDSIRPLGSGSVFTVALDAVAGATFVMSLAIDDSDVSLGCADIGRADGLAEAYCGRDVHCPDFAPGASTPTRGMCDASCGFCDGGGRSTIATAGLYASVTVFPEHAIGGSGAAGKTVWPSASVALGSWEFNSRSPDQTKQCLQGDWFCYFPGASDFDSSGEFRWVASGTGRFIIVVRPNCNIPAAAYPADQRAQHAIVCHTSWRLGVRTPMMVTSEYDIGPDETVSPTVAPEIATALGVSPDKVDVIGNMLAHRAIVHIHTDDLAEAESVRAALVQLLRDQLLAGMGGMAGTGGTGVHKVCIVPERHIAVRTIEVKDQDPCVMDANSECHAQLQQMFQRRVLPVMAFATAFRALPGLTPAGDDEEIPVAVDVGLRAMTAEQATTTLDGIERRAGVVRVADVVEHGPGHRRRLQSADEDEDSALWCSDRAAAINTACCSSDGACTGGVPSSCDFVCALAFIPYWHACDQFLINDAATAPAMLGLYAQCEIAASGDGICERVAVRTPPTMAEIVSGNEVAVALTLSAPDADGSTTLDLTVGVEQVTMETTAQPCVLAEYSECAAQAAAMFAVDRPGWGSQPLVLEPLAPLIGGSGAGLITVRATLVIAAVSGTHADEIMAAEFQ